MYDDTENEDRQAHQRQALEPVEQDSILFHGEQITAARLADGRICVVLRWVCESLKLQTGGQVRRIERTAATAQELIRVKVQTKGGIQTMPAITLRGFSPWVLGINPNEVKSEDPVEAERIRTLIVAYQEEAKDVLYEHFVNKRRPALPVPHEAQVPIELMEEPGPDASHAERATYHEVMALWHRWKADYYTQQWRGEVEEWRGSVESRLETKEAVLDLIPEIIERLGPEKLTPKHQGLVQYYVGQLSKATGKSRGAIYSSLYMAFSVPKYQDIPEAEWDRVANWFKVQTDQGQKK